MAEKTTKSTILADLNVLERDAKGYFATAEASIPETDEYFFKYGRESWYFWKKISNDLQIQAEFLVSRVLAQREILLDNKIIFPFCKVIIKLFGSDL